MSKNKIILTSIISIFIAMPAMAEFVNGQQIADGSGLLSGMACDADTLGTTSDPANIEAIWTPNEYNISYYCADGSPAFISSMLVQNNNVSSANYGEGFTFAEGGCGEEGYHSTGWSCTRDTIANDTPTIYSIGEELQAWDIPYNLTCTEVREGNTIELNWYNDYENDDLHISTECTYGEANSLTVPQTTPVAPQGYTFGGWKMVESQNQSQPIQQNPSSGERTLVPSCAAIDNKPACNNSKQETYQCLNGNTFSPVCSWNDEDNECSPLLGVVCLLG